MGTTDLHMHVQTKSMVISHIRLREHSKQLSPSSPTGGSKLGEPTILWVLSSSEGDDGKVVCG